jgi:hypothetical protein
MRRHPVQLLAAAGLVVASLLAPGLPAVARPSTALVGSTSGNDPYFRRPATADTRCATTT